MRLTIRENEQTQTFSIQSTSDESEVAIEMEVKYTEKTKYQILKTIIDMLEKLEMVENNHQASSNETNT